MNKVIEQSVKDNQVLSNTKRVKGTYGDNNYFVLNDDGKFVVSCSCNCDISNTRRILKLFLRVRITPSKSSIIKIQSWVEINKDKIIPYQKTAIEEYLRSFKINDERISFVVTHTKKFKDQNLYLKSMRDAYDTKGEDAALTILRHGVRDIISLSKNLFDVELNLENTSKIIDNLCRIHLAELTFGDTKKTKSNNVTPLPSK